MRKNPTLTTSSRNLKPVIDGIENLPIPSGKIMDVQEECNKMPEINMKENNGGNPSVSSPSFASGASPKNSTSRGSNPFIGKMKG